jgi:hypothetical protein
MSWVAVGYVGGAAIMAGGAYMSARSQSDAISSAAGAGKYEQRYALMMQKRYQEIYERLLAEGKPLRDAAYAAAEGAIKLLEQDVLREPGTGPVFETGLRRGLESLSTELAPYGATLGDSPVLTGRITEGLISRDIENVRSDRFKLAGFAPDTTGSQNIAISGANAAGATAAGYGSDLMNLGLSEGLARAGLWENLGKIGGGTFMNLFSNRNQGSLPADSYIDERAYTG